MFWPIIIRTTTKWKQIIRFIWRDIFYLISIEERALTSRSFLTCQKRVKIWKERLRRQKKRAGEITNEGVFRNGRVLLNKICIKPKLSIIIIVEINLQRMINLPLLIKTIRELLFFSKLNSLELGMIWFTSVSQVPSSTFKPTKISEKQGK